MFESEFRKLYIPILIKSKCALYTENTDLLVLAVTDKLNDNNRFPFINKGLIFSKEKALWLKRTRGGGVYLYESKRKGCKKLDIPSKSIAIMTKKDFDSLKIKQKPLLTYKTQSPVSYCSVFRINKKLEIHIDTVSSKVAAICSINGLFTVRKNYAKENKSLALVNYQWIKKSNVEGVDCIWSKNFSKLLIAMGLHLP
jgi:hypothetical protein